MSMFAGSGLADRRFLFAPAQHPVAGGTVTPDLSVGAVWQVFMPAGNITIANPINMVVGDQLTFAIVQDSVGLRTVTWGNAFYRASTLALSTAANASDAVTFIYAPQGFWGQIAAAALNLVNV